MSNANPVPLPPAVGYVRVSTIRQAERGLSVDLQPERICDYARSRGFAVTKVHSDEGISGRRSDNRPGLAAAIAEAVELKAPLIVYSLSRFARSTRDCLRLADQISKGGAGLISLSESIDTTSAHGRFFFVLVAALAQLESDQISERMRAVAAYKKSRGEYYGERPFGFELVDYKAIEVKRTDGTTRIKRVGGRLVEGGDELDTLTRLVEGRVAGRTWQSIAGELNTLGRRTRRGTPFGVSQLNRLFRRHAPRLGVAANADAEFNRRQRAAGLAKGRATAAANRAARTAAKQHKPKPLPRIVFGPLWSAVDGGAATQTRRPGWQDVKAGDRLLAVDAAVGPSRTCVIQITGVRRESLAAVNKAAVKREGFATWTTAEFAAHFVARFGGRPDQPVTVLTFKRAAAV